MGEVDRATGGKIRARRAALSMSQDDLARLLDVTRQQVRKYEAGSIRTSASRLWQIADALDVPITFFFEDFLAGRACGHGRSPSEAYSPHADVFDLALTLTTSSGRSEESLVDLFDAMKKMPSPSLNGTTGSQDS